MQRDRQGGWIVIPVEVAARELYSRLLVGVIAAARGHRVLIGQDRVIRRLARFLPKGIIYDKSLGATGDRKVARYARLGFTLTALDEESTGFYANPDLYLSWRLSEHSLERAARWFTISDTMSDLARSRYPAFADRFVTTGLPRTDTWRPPFHALHAEEVARIRREMGRFVLFNSNFGTIIHAREKRFVEGQWQRGQKAHGGLVAYQTQVIEEAGRVNLAAFLTMLPHLRQWFPEHRIVIRPHPSEDRGFWRDFASRHEGLEVHDRGLATPWILASDALVHHGCTTGIEAELLGRPQVMYAPHPDAHHDTKVMAAFCPIAHDLDTLRAIMTGMVEGGSHHPRPRAPMEAFYASLDGRMASERMVDEFERIGARGEALPGWLNLLRFSPRHLVARYGVRSARAKAYSRQKWPGTTTEALGEAIGVMAPAAGLAAPPAIREVFPQLWQLGTP